MLRKAVQAIKSSVNSLKGSVKDFLKDEKGVTTLEYGVLAAGIAVVIGAIVSTDGVFNQTIEELFDRILESLPSTTSSGS